MNRVLKVIFLGLIICFTPALRGAALTLEKDSVILAAHGKDTLMASIIEDELSDESLAGNVVRSERLSSAPSLADAIRGFTGLQIKDYGGVGGLKTVNVRSLGSEHTAVMIDGIAVENAQNMQVDLGRFSPESFSSALLRTGSSVALTSAKEAGSGAVLSLTSAEPTFAGRRDLFKTRVKGGSFGTFAPSMTWNHKFDARTAISTNSEFITSNGRYRFHEKKYISLPSGAVSGYDTTLTRRNGDLNSFKVQSHLFARLSDRSRFDATAYWYDSERGLPGPVVRRSDYNITTKDRQTDRDFFLQGGWTLKAERNLLKIKGKYSFDYTRYRTSPDVDPQAMPYDNKYRQSAVWLSVADRYNSLAGLPFDLDAAADVQYNYLDANSRDFVYPERLSLWGSLTLRHSGAVAVYSAGGQYAMASDWYGSDGEGFTKEDKTRQAFSPYADVLVRIVRGGDFSLSVKGFTRKTFRMPSFNDLYYTLVGNSSLSPEKAWQSDLGLLSRWNVGADISIEGRIEGYYNKVTDKIIAVPTANQFRWTMYNIGKVRIKGLEAEVVASRSGKVNTSLLLRYTYQKAQDYTYPSRVSYKGQIPYIPLHSGSAALDISWKGWTADITLIADSQRWSSSANLDDYHMDSFFTADFWLSKSFEKLTLRLSLNNLLDRQYEIVLGYPMPGVNAFAAIEYSL